MVMLGLYTGQIESAPPGMSTGKYTASKISQGILRDSYAENHTALGL